MAVAQGNWGEVIKHGLSILRVDPWDVPTLLDMARATEGMAAIAPGDVSICTLVFLKYALEANPKDPEVNRVCGIVLGKQGQSDEAIARLHCEE